MLSKLKNRLERVTGDWYTEEKTKAFKVLKQTPHATKIKLLTVKKKRNIDSEETITKICNSRRHRNIRYIYNNNKNKFMEIDGETLIEKQWSGAQIKYKSVQHVKNQWSSTENN